ncbi:pyridoxal reductase-like [Teratosphaeria destructans]|uniref:Pyridoxal reductase-like n=1 Tax=Teratosphaeria destructans TaxID=418781 RepID=A0A9W7SMD1_9PEZI|nr:pyridoxal reductase-like [Teratosphaeria destructans]
MASKIMDKAESALGLGHQSNIKTVAMTGHQISELGYGLMGLTWRDPAPPLDQSFAAMKEALHQGANFWNGGEIYGNAQRNSLHLLVDYFQKYPEDVERVVISIKGGMQRDSMQVDGSAENTRRSIQEAIDVLGKVGKKLDVWESARVDPKTPIEVTMEAAKEFVDAGTLGGVALSECSADTIRRASKITKIVAVEQEFSLWATEIVDNGVAAACRELDIPIVAYSPLGRGFLTGQIKKPEDIPEGDLRKHLPRFAPENFHKNIELVYEVERLAEKKGVKPGQLAISWILAKSGRDGLPLLLPIPGATTAERVKENMVVTELKESDVKEIDALLEKFASEGGFAGGRYGGPQAALCFGDTTPLNG